jgi:hypothetical protein
MNQWLVQFDYSEEENSPTGSLYLFSASKNGIVLCNTEHYNMSNAWEDLLSELQTKGEL